MSQNYQILRGALRSEYAEVDDEVIEQVVADLYGPGVSANDAEDFLGGIGNAFSNFGRGVAHVARQAAPVLGNALPGIASGAATGAALGPWGALAGAAIGGVSSALSAGGRHDGGHGASGAGSPARIAGATRSATTARTGQLGQIARIAGPALAGMTSGGAAIASRPGGVGGQIAGLLARPEVQRALTSQLLGPLGRTQVSVGGTPVPTSAVMNMLGSLFAQAAHESSGADESMPVYLMNDAGEFAVDAADPDARADWLAQLFSNTPPPRFASKHADVRQLEEAFYVEDQAGPDEEWDEDWQDNWEQADAYDDDRVTYA